MCLSSALPTGRRETVAPPDPTQRIVHTGAADLGRERQRTLGSATGAAEESAAGRQGRAHHGNRHGRSEQARQAVLEAADGLLVEKGFTGLTMEGIAARAGVAKQTVYRWWPSKTDVLVDAFLQDLAEELTPPDHGDLTLDLHAYLRQLAHFLGQSDPGAVFRALIAQTQHDPAFAADFRARYLDEQRKRDRLPLERAVRQASCPPTSTSRPRPISSSGRSTTASW